jgi:hypothetical protein
MTALPLRVLETGVKVVFYELQTLVFEIIEFRLDILETKRSLYESVVVGVLSLRW